MGAICCMWLGSRRAGHALLNALAYPAMGILLITLMLAYSRGALIALAIGLTLWFCIVPLRLRGAAVLLIGGLGAGAVVGWDFSRRVLTTDNIPLGERTTAGHQLGVLLLAMVLVLTLTGIAIGFVTGRRAPSRVTRTRAGAVLLALIVIALVGFAGALAHSHRGFDRQHLPRGRHADQSQRQAAAQHARAPDGRGERACALLESGAAGV